ncbi:MAG: tetratricopeptide repeat protein [Desulfobacteraceae bacterium]|nr:tetratricopeptide repeat protein [Pseudomonadota bacterium]MCG2757621.1 tetratricopeptide repeat protein [Desulfobacteraceae bacterium]
MSFYTSKSFILITHFSRCPLYLYHFISYSFFYPLSSFAEPVITINADKQIQFAEHYFRAGEYFRAIGEYKRFIYFFPDDQRQELAMYKIGLSYFNGEKFQEAIDAFNELLTKFPATSFRTEVRFRISECFIKLKDYLKAIGNLNDIAFTAENIDIADQAYYRRGWIYLEMSRWEEAETSFRLISKKNWDKGRLESLSHEMSKKKDLKSKSPTAAGILAIIPGAGHLYCERYKDAAIAFILNSAMIYAAYEAFDNNLDALGGIITFFELGFYSGNIYSAVNCAHKYNRNANKNFFEYLRQNSRINLGLSPGQEKEKAAALVLSYNITF